MKGTQLLDRESIGDARRSKLRLYGGTTVEALLATYKFEASQCEVVDPERLELPTPAFEAQCSIQLSYGSTLGLLA